MEVQLEERELSQIMRVEPEVLAALGVTAEQLADMGLRAFWELATDRGFDVGVSFREPFPPREGRLLVTMNRDAALSPKV